MSAKRSNEAIRADLRERLRATGDRWTVLVARLCHDVEPLLARAERAEAQVRDVRGETLREAADEVHREGRWQQEMRQRRGQSLSDLSTREYFIDRLALVEQTLRDRGAVAPSEPQDEVLFRTPTDWCELFGVIVLDPDGWRSDMQSWDQPVTREEFNRRANMSTIGPRSLLSDQQETTE